MGSQFDAQKGGASPYLDEISSFLDGIAEPLWRANKKIHDNPETAFEEKIAHQTLTELMETYPEWKVTKSAYGLETAWVAVYDTGKEGPVISYNAEMDALPGLGHACGHNLIATASVAAALATAAVVKAHSLPGKIVIFGTPAEESGGGKIVMLRAGAYEEHKVDINLISHPFTEINSALMRTSAYTRFKVEYIGREAHAAAAPWEGINALDALITAYNAISVLRQQTMAGDIIQGYITDGGMAPNIIHARAAGDFIVRADTQARMWKLRKKVDGCFAAGAQATGAKLNVTEAGGYADHVSNLTLARSYTRHFNSLGPERPIETDQDKDAVVGKTSASSDQGNVSYTVPSLSPLFGIPAGPSKAGPHNPEFAASASTREAFDAALMVGKALAGTALDVLTQEGLLEEVKKEWRDKMKGLNDRDQQE